MNKNLTNEQNDYAIFLPAISSFYATYIGKQQHEEYVPKSRMPHGIPEMEMMNFLNDQEGLFNYKWALYSAGHADLDLSKVVPKEDMIRQRDPNTILLADSGGFQIGKGVWEADWLDPNDAKANAYRSKVLKWLCNISDYSMTLDVPTWSAHTPAADKINIHSYDDAVKATQFNHEYFMKNATPGAKFLNVLQGSNHTEAEDWYQRMKKYSDPTQYENYFRGWAMGAANMADPHLALHRIITIINDGLLEEGKQDWMHFLGTSKLEWAVILTAVQRAVRRTHNPNFTISFDCASPFLATANGQIYHQTVTPDYRTLTKENKSGKWSYRMSPTVDNKAYANDTRKFSDGTVADGIHDIFEDSPISEHLEMKDICVYAPGDLNKIGKEGRTSWDSFSYALMMGHNVWHHINSVQEANRQFDNGSIPKALVNDKTGLTIVDIIDAVFATPDFQERKDILDYYKNEFLRVPGARGMGGKKAMQIDSQVDSMFDLDVKKALEHEEARQIVKPPKAKTQVVDEVMNNLFE